MPPRSPTQFQFPAGTPEREAVDAYAQELRRHFSSFAPPVADLVVGRAQAGFQDGVRWAILFYGANGPPRGGTA